ncbi:alkaline-phosphatase-like protein [Peziza echinospora]|nr:alkaline-phosphatase-like protein [Peziza echinospora]
MAGNASWLQTVTANILLLVGVFTFAFGFFPYKPFLPGLSVFNQETEDVKAPFDKVVFMVIDALRSDFIYSNTSNFRFTQSLISGGNAFPFTAHAGAPTITMPRIKSMLTGSVPGFLDLILNFAESDTTSTLSHQDNWPSQIKARGGNVVMYGDDTWIKLLPDVFHRSEGTTSFFVSDFVEVDNNVTRHINPELRNNDWDALILHYLGLDHVGHKAGPKSSFMPLKQAEMDGIIKTIYTTITNSPHLKNTLFILCGDHGMNDAGGHGGSTSGETSAALLFMSPKFQEFTPAHGFPAPTLPKGGEFTYHKRVQQADVAATLSALLHLPIPRNNLGSVIPEFLGMFQGAGDGVKVLLHNARQMQELVKAAYPGVDKLPTETLGFCPEDLGSLSEKPELACLWARVSEKHRAWAAAGESVDGEVDSKHVEEALLRFIKRAQDILSMAASNYNLPLMGFGILAALTASIISTYTLFFSSFLKQSTTTTTKSLSTKDNDNTNTKKTTALYPKLALVLITLTYCIMMFASSYVEEEQNFWYWITSAWVFGLFIKNIRSPTPQPLKHLLPLLLLRITRRWNQTGQKHQGAPDIVTSLLLPNPTLLWILIFATYAYIGFRLLRASSPSSSSPSAQPPQTNPLEHLTTTLLLPPLALLFKASSAAIDSVESVPAWMLTIVDAAKLTVWAGYGDIILHAQILFLALFSGVLVIYAISILSYSEETELGRRRNKLLRRNKVWEIFALLVATQTRFWNVPLVGVMLGMREGLNIASSSSASSASSGDGDGEGDNEREREEENTNTLLINAISTLLLAHTTFFATGGSNNISSLDLSSAYNGISTFNIALVGILGFLGNFAGPVLCLLGGGEGDVGASGAQFTYHTFFFAWAATATMASCAVLRTHLFIWTVFSPKFLYTLMWSVLVHVGVGGSWGFGGVVIRLEFGRSP